MIRLMDERWERIRKHFPEEHIPDGRPGRKPIATRQVLVLWILNTSKATRTTKLCINAFKLGAATRFCVGF
jgi:hypothetical protein